MYGEVKLQVDGATQQFWWVAPVPVAGTPTLTIRHPTAGSTTPTLSRIVDPVTITTISSDRRTLTVAGQFCTTVRTALRCAIACWRQSQSLTSRIAADAR